MIIEFSKIKKNNIFDESFNTFTRNNSISFEDANISVLYAPNGVGKSCLTSVLSGSGEFILKYGGKEYSELKCNLFHIIWDQNSRNIIEGNVSDFILGDNIVEELALKNWLDDKFANIFTDVKNSLKNEFSISKLSDIKIAWLDNLIRDTVQNIAKSGSKPEFFDIKDYISIREKLTGIEEEAYDPDKFNYLRNNEKVINEILNITTITQNSEFSKIEENKDAISILEKYPDKNECIVCDTEEIDSVQLLQYKKDRNEDIIKRLDEDTKNILTKILNSIESDDPFNIKIQLREAIEKGDLSILKGLKIDLENYKGIFVARINNILLNSVSNEFITNFNKYTTLLATDLTFTEEDVIFIEQFVEKNLDKNISLKRVENKIEISLDEDKVIGVRRDELRLSSGEQNFISLTFEFLKAKNCGAEIIVIDDPISSFDSIFKNKLVFAFSMILKEKKIVILTHNTDVLRLIEVQDSRKYNLYLFNNFQGGENGFIKVNDEEKRLLIYIPELLSFLRSTDIDANIINEQLYVYSLIPFMRGYSNLIGDNNLKRELTKVMHGYSMHQIDLGKIYTEIFKKDLTNSYMVGVSDILSMNVESLTTIINKEKYPLLDRVLMNNFIYLYLRLKTEKVLTENFGIDTEKYDQLSSIISQSFNEDTDDHKRKRVAFFSKKTLLNEFNHFDGNMSIFQPAIDISENVLRRERVEVLEILSKL